MSDELTRRHSLESLKKEAKRWLDALRRNEAEARARLERALPAAAGTPTLRDVQHALAREHGFRGWAELKERLTARAAVSARTLEQYEAMAGALLEAYRTGTPAAMERHWSLTWHRRSWLGMRTYVQLDLGRQAGAADQADDITLDDARFLIAREHGFEHWNALTRYCADLAARASASLKKPVRVLAADATDAEAPSWSSRDWNEVLTRLHESQAGVLASQGQMTDAMLQDLAGMEHLTTLRMGGSKALTDSGLRWLASLPRLRHLDLSGTAVTDRGLEALGTLPVLESVSLAWTSVSDAGVAHLGHCERLQGVDLQGTATGDGALRALAGKANLGQVRTGNHVSDAGLALLHDFPVFKRWQGGEPEMDLLSYDAGPNYLFLRGPFTDRGMARLAGLDGLFALNLDSTDLNVTSAGLAPLVTLPNLGWLAFAATDESMPCIAAMPRLRFLGCQDTVAGDDGFVALSRSRSIEHIWGRRCHNLRTRGFKALAEMPALRALSVSCRNVGDDGVAALPGFPALRELMPMDVPDEGYRHIGRCEGLESLVLMYCRETGDRATEQVVGLPRLARYFASYTRITDLTPELLSGIASLEQVTFDGCAGVTNDGVAHLSRLPRLRELRVSGPRITADVAGRLPSRVRVHYSL